MYYEQKEKHSEWLDDLAYMSGKEIQGQPITFDILDI